MKIGKKDYGTHGEPQFTYTIHSFASHANALERSCTLAYNDIRHVLFNSFIKSVALSAHRAYIHTCSYTSTPPNKQQQSRCFLYFFYCVWKKVAIITLFRWQREATILICNYRYQILSECGDKGFLSMWVGLKDVFFILESTETFHDFCGAFGKCLQSDQKIQ